MIRHSVAAPVRHLAFEVEFVVNMPCRMFLIKS